MTGYNYLIDDYKSYIDDRLWAKWIALLPHTSEPKSFSEFKSDHEPKGKIDNTEFRNRIDDAFSDIENKRAGEK